MPNTSTAAVTAAHPRSSSKSRRVAPCSANPGGAVADVIQFSLLAVATKQRTVDAQTLRRARAAKALEETNKHVAAALALLEPFNTARVIAPTARLLKICANNLRSIFVDLDYLSLDQSEADSNGVSAQSSPCAALVVKKSADVLALVGVQRQGGVQ